jgi:hypothetical protein
VVKILEPEPSINGHDKEEFGPVGVTFFGGSGSLSFWGSICGESVKVTYTGLEDAGAPFHAT